MILSNSDLVSVGSPKRNSCAAFLLFCGIAASAILGPQLAIWPSTPALLFVSLAGLVAMTSGVGVPKSCGITGLMLVGWISYRCLTSRVQEFALADGLLLVSCVVSFWICRSVFASRGGVEVLFVGLGFLVFSNLIPLIQQAKDPQYVLILPRGSDFLPSGFFAYYGDCAAFLTAVALLSAGLAADVGRAIWFRLFMGVVVAAAVFGVMYTKSRGGLIALGVGGCILAFLLPMAALSKTSRWRGVIPFALPLIVVCGAWLLLMGFGGAQEARGGATGALFDDPARLFWLKLAASCIGGHPWIGGGSRSFSWENLQFWGGDWSGFSAAEPEFVHNEPIQLVTDYGIIGLLLMVLFLGSVVVSGALALLSSKGKSGVLAVSGLAALVALLFHASVHFVFHVPPSTLLLGIVLAAVVSPVPMKRPELRGGRVVRAMPLLFGSLILAGVGIKSSAAFSQMAPILYQVGDRVMSVEERLLRTEKAAEALPGCTLYNHHGKLALQAAAIAGDEQRSDFLDAAVGSFQQAILLHPFDPDSSVNLANALSSAGREEEAEKEFERAIQLQGDLERGFHAISSLSGHYVRKSERLRKKGEFSASLDQLIRAGDTFDVVASDTVWELGDYAKESRIRITLVLGPWLESLGRYEEASLEYQRAVMIPGAHPLRYLAARNLAKWGDSLWSKRKPSEALAKFMEGRRQLGSAYGTPPDGYSEADLVELRERLAGKIRFLEGAGITLQE